MNSMIRDMKRTIALVLAAVMIATFMPAMNESAYAAKKAKKPAQVKGVTAEVSEDNQVTVTWKKVKKAKKYKVSIKDGKSGLTAVKTAKKAKVTFQGGDEVKYTIKVRALKGKKAGKWSKAVTAETKAKAAPAGSQEALDKAEADKKAAEEAQAKAEADKKAAEEAKAQAEADKAKAEEDKKAAEDALAKAEADKKAAEDALAQAEADKKAAEEKQGADKEAADKAVADAEKAAADAEAAKAQAEADKKAAEDALAQAEKDKKAAEDALEEANGKIDAAAQAKKEAEEALAAAEEALEMLDDGDRSTQKEGSMHVVYSTLAMFRTDDANTTITEKDENTVTVAIKLVASASVKNFEKIALAKYGEEGDADIVADLTVEEAGTNEGGKTIYTATCSFDLSKDMIGKKMPYSIKYNTEEGWHKYTNQPYMIVLADNLLQKLYEENNALKKQAADQAAADEVAAAWAQVPDITKSSSAEDIIAAQAVIQAYDELTDDQKALVPADVKASMEAAKEVLAEIEEANAKLKAIKERVKEITAGSADTVTIDEKEYIVLSKDEETKEAKLLEVEGKEGIPWSETDETDDWDQSALKSYYDTFLTVNPTVAKLAVPKEYSYTVLNANDSGEGSETVRAVQNTKVFMPSLEDFESLSDEAKAKLVFRESSPWKYIRHNYLVRYISDGMYVQTAYGMCTDYGYDDMWIDEIQLSGSELYDEWDNETYKIYTNAMFTMSYAD